jgi:hypothetical protein
MSSLPVGVLAALRRELHNRLLRAVEEEEVSLPEQLLLVRAVLGRLQLAVQVQHRVLGSSVMLVVVHRAVLVQQALVRAVLLDRDLAGGQPEHAAAAVAAVRAVGVLLVVDKTAAAAVQE